MQDITPKLEATAQIIQSYGPAGFKVGGVDYAGSVLITPMRTTPIDAATLADITPGHFTPLWSLAEPIEILLIGTGARHLILPPELRAALKAHGVGVDAMATGPAARTYNVLMSEERRVAALLILPA